MPEILVKFQDKIVERIVTEKERLSIGRSADNDIVLDNRGVSRRHAQIEFISDGALLIDNDSLNGTFLNQRKVSEHRLSNRDTITIGKFDLVFFTEAEPTKKMSDMDGTMVLNTKKQKDLIDLDREAQEMAAQIGASILLEMVGEEKRTHALDKGTITIGKANYVDVRVGGFLTPKIQAKVEREADGYHLVNIGRSKKTKVNGEIADGVILKNGDVVQIGGSTFRFIAGAE
jgi:pSer/pThr/pTyr-binding forkhead associated (FHA) protein